MSLLISLLLGLSLGVLLLVIFENRFVYYPHKFPQGLWDPVAYGLSPEECFFTTSDGVRLHGWFFKVDNAKVTLFWCHGNAGNITHRLDNISKLLPLGINVFIFDYRGYGKSEGEPSEAGLYADATAAYDYLVDTEKADSSSIIIFGRSIGAVVGVHLAAQRPCRGMILESGFTSARDMARELFPILPLHLFIRSRFDAYSLIDKIRVPVLFVHGTHDRTVPMHLGRKLFERANEPKSFYEIPGADHNDTYVVGGAEYFDKIRSFVAGTE